VSAPGIVKPLPEEWFTVRGTNAETRFAALAGTGLHTPAERFFVRNHTSTPVLDADSWTLTVRGDGLHRARPAEFTLDDLKRLPVTTRTAFVECAGNGRSFFTSQQGQAVTGTAWTLGAVGTAEWRGVRLAEVLRRAGLSHRAVDVMPVGLDAEYVTADGTNLGHVRRPLPVSKALDDVLLAYEMNGEPLPPDHGHPVRVLVPSWVGIASVKWVGDIAVSARPLYSPWNTDFYRLFGDAHPAGGSAPLTRQTLKSAFELPWEASVPAGVERRLTGRSWSGAGAVTRVEVSTDDGVESVALGVGDRRVRLGAARTAAPAGVRPGCTTPRAAPRGSAGPPTGVRRHRARTRSWPEPRTRRAAPSRTRRSPTPRATYSTPSSGIR
jgi:DMSO/TMAO reductase YedYZ molybdopterin-dependent catalytic subunit